VAPSAAPREHLPYCDATPHRQEGQVRPADETGQCPGGSLFEIQGKAGEVTPTSCAGPADRGSRSGIPVPTDSPAHRMFRLYMTRSGPLMIIEACITADLAHPAADWRWSQSVILSVSPAAPDCRFGHGAMTAAVPARHAQNTGSWRGEGQITRRGPDKRCAWPDLAVRATAGRHLRQALAGVRVVSDAGRADLAGGVPDGGVLTVRVRRSGAG
jgi:hypothetical protein